MNWQDHIRVNRVKKGTIAENFVQEKLQEAGWVVYRPTSRHKVDFICEKKNEFVAVDVKAKAQRMWYDDTGIDARDLEVYKQLPLPVYLVFVDDITGTTYGESIAYLCIARRIGKYTYPMFSGHYVYFPLSAMKPLWKIPTEILQALRDVTERKKDYEPARVQAIKEASEKWQD